MDRRKETCSIIKSINAYKNNQLANYELIKQICNYFDLIKNEKLTQADLKFLKYISNISGIPHYYDLLYSGFNRNIDIEDYSLKTFAAELYETSLYLPNMNKTHQYQKEILDKFDTNKINRFFLSASTSFGKTHLVYDILLKMKYKNIALIFPTIALLAENLEKILSNENYVELKNNYKIHTLSETKEIGEYNIFIYTPERFLSFTDKQNIKFDFIFVDEIYKIDNEFILDEKAQENERDTAYRVATYQLLKNTKDILLAGPYIKIPTNQESSFRQFICENQIEILDYNNFEIVDKTYTNIKLANNCTIDSTINVNFQNHKRKKSRLNELTRTIVNAKENCIIYCSNRDATEKDAKSLLDSGYFINHSYKKYNKFIEHLENNFNKEWIVIKALKQGIGIHHGLIPKYIQKEIINLFNDELINILISTTTITEGVNTCAKNLIVTNDTKGGKALKKFDAQNISGRAGRFLKHYKGRVIILKNKFMDILEGKGSEIKYKNYEKNINKSEVDIFFTPKDYLTTQDKVSKLSIIKEQRKRGLPNSLFKQYKTVSRKDKILVYDNILNLSNDDKVKVWNAVNRIHTQFNLSWSGFEVIFEKVLKQIITNKNLLGMINHKTANNYSIVIVKLNSYINGGFNSLVKYEIDNKHSSYDLAIRHSADFVYNTLKYHVVKYLGVFDLIYKYINSKVDNCSMEEIPGIDRLLSKLEYNAFSEKGRLASDYGVSKNLLDYYEQEENNIAKANEIKNLFDEYELNLYNKVENIIQT
ncbi:MAG: hypothetical protein NC408_07435 [Candidatus Gastranaerophilales bacterium]|nr:hypothetical protein [Candidatus Gastranaerophilales bacterium]